MLHHTKWLYLGLALTALSAAALPPYGDPNQPYDRLPGTLETYHVKWAKPWAGGKLNVLFVVPFGDSREVVETAQRLELDYTVIMNAGHAVWEDGFYEGPTATPLKDEEAKLVLGEITRQRLSLGHTYDAIVIGKVSWPVIPAAARELILKHVERGAGLVYVTPNRLQRGVYSQEFLTDVDPEFDRLFLADREPGLADSLLAGLPLDVLPWQRFKTPQDIRDVPGVSRLDHAQTPLCILGTRHGAGRIVALHYGDAPLASSLSPYLGYPEAAPGLGEEFRVFYDYAFALLAKSITWAAARELEARLELTIAAPATALTCVPINAGLLKYCWEARAPQTVIARTDLPQAQASATLTGGQSGAAARVAWTLRDLTGKTWRADETALAADQTAALKLSLLPRGTYLLDARVFDRSDRVLAFASKSFRVESAVFVTAVTTEKDRYNPGETIAGGAAFSQALAEGQAAEVLAVDTWQRIVARQPAVLAADRASATYAIPVSQALSRLWDIRCEVRDAAGAVDSASTWVGLPDWTFDDYLWMLIFAPSPGVYNWKGDLYGDVIRKYGVNASFTHLIYGYWKLYEVNERHHLASVSYAEHLGEIDSPAGRVLEQQPARTDLDLAELSRMVRHLADTGEPLDAKQFPYVQQKYLSADWLNDRVKQYALTGRFGSPLYVLTGENYLSGEFFGVENSGFGPLTTKQFQEWCQEQYGGSLAALNAEWNSDFRSWEDVRGLLLLEAVEQNQLPRWVDFRFFMRSRVWTQFFLDWTDMLRRFVPEARTGRCGHDQYDFTRFRDRMTSSKVYVGQEENSEWRQALSIELLQSFSGDRSFLLASQSMIRWTYDLETPLNRERWPWLVLFLGLQGFDWERGLSETLGGEFCFTPDLSEPLPFLLDLSREVQTLQSGIGKLTIASTPYRSRVALLWSPVNHYISRLYPFQENAFSGTWMPNVSVVGGAPSDALALLNAARLRPTLIGPEDLRDGGLAKRGFRALVLPYNKGMSEMEEREIRSFVRQGGLLLAENTPGICSEHGKELPERRLADLFPDWTKKTVVRYGKGAAAYLAGEINGFIARMEKGDFAGADAVAALLKEYAAEEPPIEVMDERGVPRRDTLMPVFRHGSTTLLGLLRANTAELRRLPENTLLRFGRPLYVWDVRRGAYCGELAEMPVRLDMQPQYFALLPALPTGMRLAAPATAVQGATAVVNGGIAFGAGRKADIAALGQAVHLRVFGPDGSERECFRRNLVFSGERFATVLPISFSEPVGRYRVEATHAITAMKAQVWFDVTE